MALVCSGPQWTSQRSDARRWGEFTAAEQGRDPQQLGPGGAVGQGRDQGQGGKRLDRWAGRAGPGQQSGLHSWNLGLVEVCPHEISSLSISLAALWEVWLEGWVPGMLREPGE